MTQILALVLLAALAAGCAGRPPAAATGAGLRAELALSPASAAALRPVTLRLRLTDGRGMPLSPETLRASATMPEMSHGEEGINFRPAGEGVYEATHVFSMDGMWEIHLRGAARGAAVDIRIPVQVGSR